MREPATLGKRLNKSVLPQDPYSLTLISRRLLPFVVSSRSPGLSSKKYRFVVLSWDLVFAACISDRSSKPNKSSLSSISRGNSAKENEREKLKLLSLSSRGVNMMPTGPSVEVDTGTADGSAEGEKLGKLDGCMEGKAEGTALGTSEGGALGIVDGDDEGGVDGEVDGSWLGARVAMGACVDIN
mmetsp:Transcript_40219/g.61825  ORF Transcript_40219/g.61825 Transcript_40219/m.61825 type:complete len:184 (+) Transcript_40219:69-620(+)